MGILDILIIISGGGLFGLLLGSLVMMVLPSIVLGVIAAALTGYSWARFWIYIRGL